MSNDQTVRFRIGDRTYSTASLDEVSLRDVMLFQTQAADMGLTVSWADVEAAAVEMSALPQDEAGSHPQALLMLGVTVWAARRLAGEDVTFEEAVDFPMASMTFLDSPQDRKPGKAKARKGKPRKGKPRKASAPAAAPVTAAPLETTPAT